VHGRAGKGPAGGIVPTGVVARGSTGQPRRSCRPEGQNLAIAEIEKTGIQAHPCAPRTGSSGRGSAAGQWGGVGGQVYSEPPLPNVRIRQFQGNSMTHMAVGGKGGCQGGYVSRTYAERDTWSRFAPGSRIAFAMLPPGQCHRQFTKGDGATRCSKNCHRRCGRFEVLVSPLLSVVSDC